MTSFAAHSLEVLRRLFRPHGGAPQAGPHAGVETVLDGLSAVAVTEAAIADTAGLGATWPAAAAARAWSRREGEQRQNRLGEVLAGLEAEQPGAALAAAIGAAIAGRRATGFISGPDMLSMTDLLALASGRHAPLVCHLVARAPAGHAQPLGSGHEAYHAAAESGWMLLFAANVQEAVDLALVARRVAERALVPAMVVMDGEQTALAVQEVRLLDDQLAREYIGEAHATIETPTDAQRFIFGPTRRRVPRLYDLDRPLLLSPLAGPECWALGAAGRRPYFDDHVAGFLDEAFAALGAGTGRHLGPVLEHRLDDAGIVLVGQGAAVETLCAAADVARETLHVKVGVLGIRCLRPLASARITEALAGAKAVAVLERLDTPLSGDGPLAREVRILCHAKSRVVNVPFGLGGLPLRAADLLALVKELERPRRPRLYLGLDLAPARSVFPKQQALLDTLRRTHPGLSELGLRASEPAPDLRPPGSLTVAVQRRAGRDESIAGEIATMLHDELGGHVRSRPALTWHRVDEPCTDVVIHCADPLRDPGDDPPVDLVVSAGDQPRDELLARVLAFARQPAARRQPAKPPGPAPAVVTRPPAPGRRTASGETVHSLARFWDHAGVFYRSGRTGELGADPCLAAGAVPALSSTFRDVSGADAAGVLPVFDPSACTGPDPDLWMSDPDGAVAPLVISARGLLDAGIEIAAERGRRADPLRAIAGKLAKSASKLVGGAAEPPRTAGGLLQAAFDAVVEKMDDERRTSLAEPIAAVVDAVGDLPVARTRVFFDEPEKTQTGSGELFSLVVNPDACKSPKVSIAACAGRGIEAQPRNAESIEAARRRYELWQRLPDTTGATIERARLHPRIGTLPALMLSRHCLHALGPGDGAEAGSGARQALARLLAVAEFHEQPRIQKHLDAIRKLREALAERIRETLAVALPTGDLDALASGLDALGRSDMDLGALSGRIDTVVGAGQVDGARLGRLVDVARGLADLEWRLAEGPDGFGRARAGVAIAPGAVATWAGAFPYNAFQVPVLVGSGAETGALARGLLEGQIRQALAGLRLMRWGRLELDRPDDAARAVEALAGLRFEDLTADERAVCPPIFWVGDDRTLGGGGLGALLAALRCGLPVKAVVLADSGGGADGGLAVDSFGSYPAGARRDLALLAALSRRSYVVQTSLAHHEHFARGVLGALAHDGPALILVHAPSPQRHGFAIERLHEQARLAVATRAVPLLSFDPAAGGVFGSCLDLEGNPDVAARLAKAADGTALTPVDWAATETRFALHLEPLAESDTAPTPIAEYLDLDLAARAGRTPYVSVPGDDRPRRLGVGPALVADADERLRLWRTLQELAGVVTPFTARVREDVERELAAAHDAELERIRQEYEAKIADLRRQAHTEATQRITERLMALAGRTPHDRVNGSDGS